MTTTIAYDDATDLNTDDYIVRGGCGGCGGVGDVGE